MALQLLVCLSRDVTIVTGQDDFGKLSGAYNAYLGGDIYFNLTKAVNFTDGFLDCVGRSIDAYTYVFDKVSRVIIRNCVFNFATQFSTTLEKSTLMNTTITTSEAEGCRTAISSSYFYGVKMSAASQFAATLNNTLFVGCSLGIVVRQADASWAFIYRLMNSTLQNCFLNASFGLNLSKSAACLALRSTDLLVSKSRFITNITALGSQKDPADTAQLSGCVGVAYGQFTVRDCDLLTNVQAAGKLYAMVGVVAQVAGDGILVMSNLSSYFQLSTSVGEGSLFGTQSWIGGAIGNSQASSLLLEHVTAFSHVSIKANVNESINQLRLQASGLAAYLQSTFDRITHCFVFGSLDVYTDLTRDIKLGGCVAEIAGASSDALIVYNSSFNGEIRLTASKDGGNYEQALGGIIGKARSSKISHSQFLGNMSFIFERAQPFDAGGVLGLNYAGSDVASCIVVANLTFKLQSSTATVYAGCLVGSAGVIANSLATCNLSVAHASTSRTNTAVGFLAGQTWSNLNNCSATGTMMFTAADNADAVGVVGGFVGIVPAIVKHQNLFVTGKITVPDGFSKVASAFGSIGESTLNSIIAAIDIYGTFASAYYSNKVDPKVTSLFVDCNKRGNAQQSGICRTDLTTNSTLPMLGAAFAWSAAYNGRYPYLRLLPVLDANKKYVLPESGDFSADSYYIDDAGFLFPKIDFYPCRGVCYGVYSSPVVRVCDNDSEYCVNIDRAIREFPGDSCIADNAVCSFGVSFCSSEAEMLLPESESEYACQKACPGCQNGYCNQSSCICDIYSEGSTCAFNCRADTPNCFGNESLVCDMRNASCIPTPSCDNMTCVHGKCVAAPIAHCECDNLWEGDDCGVCRGFGKDCTMTQAQCDKAVCHSNGACEGSPSAPSCSCRDGLDPATNCEKCKAAMEVINGTCACGQAGVVCEDSYFCKSGSCQKTCMLLDKNCTSCSQTRLDLCAGCQEGFLLSNGACKPPKKGSAAAIAGGVVGGCAALAAVGLAVFFVVRSRKPTTERSAKAEVKVQPHKDQQPKKLLVAINEREQPLGAQQQLYTGGEKTEAVQSKSEEP